MLLGMEVMEAEPISLTYLGVLRISPNQGIWDRAGRAEAHCCCPWRGLHFVGVLHGSFCICGELCGVSPWRCPGQVYVHVLGPVYPCVLGSALSRSLSLVTCTSISPT